jgi:Peptidase family M41/C-terminal, D2-small domain, of ClpB protein/ATPase family associated with various cellular activities (AAA)
MSTEITEKPKIIIDLVAIEAKQRDLQRIKEELKTEFVGIEYIIDELIDCVRIWYLMPEVLTRPIIVSLWGMTGVGKTDLVRKMVSKLNYQDRFAEVELSNSDALGYWQSSVSGILASQNLNDGKPSIVLFDEIQRFSTLDPDGNALPNVRFQDFWELLSDGKLAKRDVKEDIDQYLNSFGYNQFTRKKQATQQATQNAQNPPNTEGSPLPQQPQVEEATVGIWQAERLKKLFGLEESVTTLADMTEDEVLLKMQEQKQKKKIYEAIDHAKTLIIISGNLDDAFQMAGDVSETDVDADIFYAYTAKITLMDIKNALTRKFKPEQVARFGNIHLIYRSLKRRDFEELIDIQVQKVVEKTKQYFGIDLEVSAKIKKLIYQNGVFPVQGVRPVFSSVIDVLETNLAKFLFEALMKGKTKISMDYNTRTSKLTAKFDDTTRIELKYVGRVDRIRQETQLDNLANISVHEAGHAVIYGALFGLSPLQLKSRVASSMVGGFTFPHQIHSTRQRMLDKIKVYLAGGLAEELIFGEANATVGRSSDRMEATFLAVEFVRNYGFLPQFQAVYSLNPSVAMKIDVTDGAIESMIQELALETRALLETHKDFLIDLSKRLRMVGNLDTKEVAAIAAKYGLDLKVMPEAYLAIPEYQKMLNEQNDVAETQ